MKRKIAVVTGTRAEYGLLKPVIEQIIKSKKLNLYLIVTGMHLSKKHGKTINEIKNDGFKIYTTIDMIPKGDSNYDMCISLGKGIIEFSKLYHKLKPDINLILGDRDEVFASAVAASHMNIPIAHIHGGDKSKGGVDEYNRHAITKISNIHFAATKKSKERIIKMGEDPAYVYLTGSPGIDDIINNKITRKTELEKKYQIKFTGKEIVLIQHPVSTQSELSNKQISTTLNVIAKLNMPTIAIAPNSDAGNKAIFNNLSKYSKKFPFIKVFRNLPRRDYLGLLKNCSILIGNSSSGIIEASYFNTPVVNIGIRQMGRERNENVIDVISENENLIHNVMMKALRRKKKMIKLKKNIYGDGKSAKKIIHYLETIKISSKLIQKQIHY